MYPKVYIPQPIPDVALNRLKTMAEVEVFPYLDRVIGPEELLKAVRGENYLYALGEIPYTAEVIDAALPDLKGIAAMYVFPKFVDIKAATRRGIPVTGIPNMLVETTAEFTFMLMIATAWRLPEQERALREKQWKQYQSMVLLGTRIFDKTLGIVGLGKIGMALAKKAQGCGMRGDLYQADPALPGGGNPIECRVARDGQSLPRGGHRGPDADPDPRQQRTRRRSSACPDETVGDPHQYVARGRCR